MKVIGIEGGHRKNGNTEKLVKNILLGAENAQAKTDFFKLINLDIKQCRGCSACRPEGVCVIKDDMDALVNAIQEADAIVFGSPVYMWQITGTAKIFMDRLCRLLAQDYSSRLNGVKKLAFAYTQGNPDATAFQSYFDYNEKMFGFLGFQNAGRMLAVGTRAVDDITAQTQVMDDAIAFGKKLAGK